jgi:hypothetical protein
MSEPGAFAGRASELGALSLTRARWVALASSAALLAGWFTRAAHPVALLALALVVAAAALGPAGRTPLERVSDAAAFLARSRWTQVDLSPVERDGTASGSRWTLRARGHAEVVVGRLAHVGRLDLSGEGAEVARELAVLMDTAATLEEPRRLSWHCYGVSDPPATVLAAPAALAPSARWGPVRADELARWCAAGEAPHGAWLLERWRYLRGADEVLAVFAVRASAPGGPADALARLVAPGTGRDLTVSVAVESARAARAVVGRQAHAWRANLALAHVAGFRQRASFELATGVLEARERAVAAGGALGRAAAYVVVRAPSRRALAAATAALTRDARSLGVRLERGDGRHASWFAAQLPGCPSGRLA